MANIIDAQKHAVAQRAVWESQIGSEAVADIDKLPMQTMSQTLRKGPQAIADAGYQQELASADAAFEDAAYKLPSDTIAFRGIDDLSFFPDTVGSVYADDGIVYTSLAKEHSLLFAGTKGGLLRIELPEGTAGVWGANFREAEFLLKRGSRFEVTAVDTITGRYGDPIRQVTVRLLT